MTKPYETVTLAKDATSVTLPAPRPEYAGSVEPAQTVAQTAAGGYFVYDKDVTNREASIVFEMSLSQWQALQAFVIDTIKGSLYTFTYTDHYGVSHADCRLLGPLEWGKTRSARYVVTLRMALGEAIK